MIKEKKLTHGIRKNLRKLKTKKLLTISFNKSHSLNWVCIKIAVEKTDGRQYPNALITKSKLQFHGPYHPIPVCFLRSDIQGQFRASTAVAARCKHMVYPCLGTNSPPLRCHGWRIASSPVSLPGSGQFHARTASEFRAILRERFKPWWTL